MNQYPAKEGNNPMAKGGTGSAYRLLLTLMFLLSFPSASFSWGAIKNYAETHQYILTEARKLASSDPAFVQKFPSAEELMNYDYVIVTPLGKSGPGPDVDGASPYSWHYYNPRTGKGLAPRKVGDFFNVMMHKRVRGESQAREAAWAAHFLADMFVPYHVVGMPEEAAWQVFMGGIPMEERETGPAELYSRQSPAPAGWGGGGDFSSALELFLEYPRQTKRSDWFDPWFSTDGGNRSGIAPAQWIWNTRHGSGFQDQTNSEKELFDSGTTVVETGKSEMGNVSGGSALAAADFTRHVRKDRQNN